MGQRISEWEAKAMRTADGQQAKASATASQTVRVRIQEDIEKAKKQRKRESRAREQERQFDRQREEIHPAHVLDMLDSFAPSEDEQLRLPKATPDPVKDYPVQPLTIRYRNRETDT